MDDTLSQKTFGRASRSESFAFGHAPGGVKDLLINRFCMQKLSFAGGSGRGSNLQRESGGKKYPFVFFCDEIFTKIYIFSKIDLILRSECDTIYQYDCNRRESIQ